MNYNVLKYLQVYSHPLFQVGREITGQVPIGRKSADWFRNSAEL